MTRLLRKAIALFIPTLFPASSTPKLFALMLIAPALLAPRPAAADIRHLADLPAPKKALVKGACLEYNRPKYVQERLAQFDLLAGASLYPEYWISDAKRRSDLRDNMLDLFRRNNRIAMTATLFFPYKVWGVDPEAPPSIWLRDMEGRAVEGAPGCYLLDYSRPETVRYIAERQTQLIKQFRYFEGVYLDQFSLSCPAPGRRRFDLNGDGAPDSRTELNAIWRKGALALLKRLRQELGKDNLLLVNINEQLPAEFRPLVNGVVREINLSTEITAARVKGFLSELQRDSREMAQPVANIVVQWADPGLVDSCPELPWQALNARDGQRLLVRAYDDQDRFRLGLTLALLTDSFCAFELGEQWPGQIWWFNEFNAPLEKAMSATEEVFQGVFFREFLSGYVFLNASGKRLERSYDEVYHDMSNHQENSRFTIDPGGIKILVRKTGGPQRYSFQRLPVADWSLYLPEAMHPHRQLPPNVRSIEVRESQDPSRRGQHNLIDGVKTDPSAWVSKLSMPQHVEIQFNRPTRLNSLSVWPLSPELRHQIFDFQVKVLINGEWVKAADVQSNTETRKITIPINRNNCSAVRFQALRTGDGRLQLREIEWN